MQQTHPTLSDSDSEGSGSIVDIPDSDSDDTEDPAVLFHEVPNVPAWNRVRTLDMAEEGHNPVLNYMRLIYDIIPAGVDWINIPGGGFVASHAGTPNPIMFPLYGCLTRVDINYPDRALHPSPPLSATKVRIDMCSPANPMLRDYFTEGATLITHIIEHKTLYGRFTHPVERVHDPFGPIKLSHRLFVTPVIFDTDVPHSVHDWFAATGAGASPWAVNNLPLAAHFTAANRDHLSRTHMTSPLPVFVEIGDGVDINVPLGATDWRLLEPEEYAGGLQAQEGLVMATLSVYLFQEREFWLLKPTCIQLK